MSCTRIACVTACIVARAVAALLPGLRKAVHIFWHIPDPITDVVINFRFLDINGTVADVVRNVIRDTYPRRAIAWLNVRGRRVFHVIKVICASLNPGLGIVRANCVCVAGATSATSSAATATIAWPIVVTHCRFRRAMTR